MRNCKLQFHYAFLVVLYNRRSWRTVLEGTPVSAKNEQKVILWMKKMLDQELTLVNQMLTEVFHYLLP